MADKKNKKKDDNYDVVIDDSLNISKEDAKWIDKLHSDTGKSSLPAIDYSNLFNELSDESSLPEKTVFANDKSILFQIMEESVDRRRSPVEVRVLLGASDDFSGVRLTRPLSSFDRMILMACFTLWLEDPTPELGVAITCSKIYNLLFGKRLVLDTENAGDFESNFEESMVRLTHTDVSVHEGSDFVYNEKETRLSTRVLKITSVEETDRLLDASRWVINNNRNTKTVGYKIKSKPRMLEYLQRHEKLVYVPMSLVKDNIAKNSASIATVKFHLIREIHNASTKDLKFWILVINEVLEKNYIDFEKSHSARGRMLKKIYQLLAYFKEIGFISGYDDFSFGRRGAVMTIKVALSEKSDLTSKLWN